VLASSEVDRGVMATVLATSELDRGTMATVLASSEVDSSARRIKDKEQKLSGLESG